MAVAKQMCGKRQERREKTRQHRHRPCQLCSSGLLGSICCPWSHTVPLCSEFPFTETNWLKFYSQGSKQPTPGRGRTNLTACVNSAHSCHSLWLSGHPEMLTYYSSFTRSSVISSFSCVLTVLPPTSETVNLSSVDKVKEY